MEVGATECRSPFLTSPYVGRTFASILCYGMSDGARVEEVYWEGADNR